MLEHLRGLLTNRSTRDGRRASTDLPPPSGLVAVETPTQGTGAMGRYAKATEDLRAAAKWLLAVLAAAGAVLLAGLQLTKLGELQGEWLRLASALVASVAAVSAVGYMIAATSRIFTNPWVTLANLDVEALDEDLLQPIGQAMDEPRSARTLVEPVAERRTTLQRMKHQLEERLSRPDEAQGDIDPPDEPAEKIDYEALRRKVRRDRQWLYRHVAADVPDLHRRLRTANDAARILQTGVAGADPQLAALRAATAEVIDCANYHHIRLSLRQLRRRLAWATAVVVTAILVFAYATNPPAKPSSPVRVQIVPSASA